MAKQTFTTGQVLTAAQMTSLQQTAMGGGAATAKTTSYVLTAADAGTVVQMNAAGATTITVNTALFAAGDSVQIQNIGAGVCTVTAGTATVTTAGSLALSQWEGGSLYFTSTSASIFFDIVQSSGMTNPMTTTGDMIYSSSGSTPARLGIGTTGQVVTVAGGIPSWATPASGGMTSLASGSVVANLSLASISGSYTDLYLILNNVVTTVNDTGGVRINADTTAANYQSIGSRNIGGTLTQQTNGGYSFVDGCLGSSFMASTSGNSFIYYFPNYAQTTGYKTVRAQGYFNNNLSTFTTTDVVLGYKSTSAITQLELKTAGSNFASQGTYVLYGVK
jgi:hypothetical protein